MLKYGDEFGIDWVGRYCRQGVATSFSCKNNKWQPRVIERRHPGCSCSY